MGRYRRNWLVPVPEANDLAALNEQLLAGCLASRQRQIGGRKTTVGTGSESERGHLLPRAEENFPIDEVLYPLVVDAKRRVKVKSNWYSAPLWPGLRVTARVWPSSIEIEYDGDRVARHQRCYGRGLQILDLEHYLDVLEKKPGAMAGSTPLEQWRQSDRWPVCLDQIWKKLDQRHGKGAGTREMTVLVRAGLSSGWERLIAAVEEALRLGVTDSAAVLHILNMPDAEQRRRYEIALSGFNSLSADLRYKLGIRVPNTKPLHVVIPPAARFLTRADERVGIVADGPGAAEHHYYVRFADGAEDCFSRHDLTIFKDTDAQVPMVDSTNLRSEGSLSSGAMSARWRYGLNQERSDVDRRGFYLPQADLHWDLRVYRSNWKTEREGCHWEIEKFICKHLEYVYCSLWCLLPSD